MDFYALGRAIRRPDHEKELLLGVAKTLLEIEILWIKKVSWDSRTHAFG